MPTASRDPCSASPAASPGAHIHLSTHQRVSSPKAAAATEQALGSHKLALHEQRGYKRLWHPFFPVPKRFLGQDVTLSSLMGLVGSGHKGHTGFDPTPHSQNQRPLLPFQSLTFLRNSSATMRALALTESFISLISLSISSMKWMTKSTSLCLYICSVWKFVIKKLMS